MHKQYKIVPHQTPQHHYRKRRLSINTDNLLSVLEGIEGGFAIFTGILVGLSFETIDRRLLIVTAVISIIVNGFNSSAVRYSSQHYIDELDGHEKKSVFRYYLTPALVEFIVYLIVCLVVLLPLLLLPSLPLAIVGCVILTLTVLFCAGYYRGRILRTRPLRDALELTVLGALIITVGAIAGFVLSR
ncbi:hypothetical protein CYG49_00170 [Candidatus Saccharibacteria bacterium]|nr:MAG: hypothetical protein CYG49_00170 [Candidatus Saccharibacteria bacterium]